jgi:hypothetical protein
LSPSAWSRPQAVRWKLCGVIHKPRSVQTIASKVLLLPLLRVWYAICSMNERVYSKKRPIHIFFLNQVFSRFTAIADLLTQNNSSSGTASRAVPKSERNIKVQRELRGGSESISRYRGCLLAHTCTNQRSPAFTSVILFMHQPAFISVHQRHSTSPHSRSPQQHSLIRVPFLMSPRNRVEDGFVPCA